jgi:hypothetical protein
MELRSDHFIVAQAIEHNWRAYKYALIELDPSLSEIVKLKEIVYNCTNPHHRDTHFKYNKKQLRECNEIVDTCLDQFTFKMDIYLYSFLAGFSQAKSKLQVLGMKLGKYHGALIKKKIGEYVGLQHGLLYSLASEARSKLIYYREESDRADEREREYLREHLLDKYGFIPPGWY